MLKFKYDETKEQRLDKYLAQNHLKSFSRNKIQNLIKEERILVNNLPTKSNYRLQKNDQVTVDKIEEEVFSLKPVDFPLEIIFEDDYLIVINKPKGLVVHPGAGQEEVTVVTALLGMNKNLAESDNDLRPGIVHRLDKDTSGLMVVAKTEDTLKLLQEMFKYHEVNREYLTICEGSLEHDFGTIDAPIGRDVNNRLKMGINPDGRKSITYFSVLKRFTHYTLLKCKLKTGRTHQIRVHLKYIGHPIVGDPLYGRKNDFNINEQMLYAHSLSFIHPQTGEFLEFELPMREDFCEFIESVDDTNV